MALKQTITREFLVEKIGDENIFNYYFGDFDLNKSYHSVFRTDNKKSTGFYVSKHGSIIYNDFTTCEKYDFVHFVMKLYSLSYYFALQQIAIDFNLIKGTKSSSKPAIVKHINQPKKKPEKIIKVGVVSFKEYHLKYWEQFAITKEELKNNHVYAVNNLYINGFQISTEDNELRFAYLFKDGEKEYLKIYSPYDSDYKWVSSVPLSLIYGIEELPHISDTLYITKSVKDCIVLKKFFTDVIAFQNESKDACTKETMKVLKKQYKRIVLIFDCDPPGKKAAEWYKENYNLELYFMPTNAYEKYGIKDCSDFVKHFGLTIFKQYLKYIKLL